ncbi:MAG: type II toxin-antitoxin system VapC family toxin [Magnetococcales bacterium]|nr:type II toxin-antitoxin system VapC family toxin [Magnetococcales bacterium]
MIDSNLLILDTHIWIWWINQDGHLSRGIARRIEQDSGKLAISSASVYEALLQVRRGRLIVEGPLDEWLQIATEGAEIMVLPVNASIAAQAAALPLHHGDPIDRIIIASALHHNALLISVDGQFPNYSVLGERLVTEQG